MSISQEAKPVVFIVDDDLSVRKSLSRLLESLGFDTETFASGDEFLTRQKHQGVGCLVLDVRMPGLSGMDLQQELETTGDCMPIVFVTGHGDITMSVQAMKKGAVDFLTKPFNEDELLHAVNAAIEQDRRQKADRRELGDLLRRIDKLTPREAQILRYVIGGMLNKQIAFFLHISEKTVKIHRHHIVEKLGVSSVAQLAVMAEKAGVVPISCENLFVKSA
jgi:FixJ family two-component response regulator